MEGLDETDADPSETVQRGQTGPTGIHERDGQGRHENVLSAKQFRRHHRMVLR